MATENAFNDEVQQAAKSKAAMDEFIKKWILVCTGLAIKKHVDENAASDVAQDAIVGLLRMINNGKQFEENPIFGILENKVADYFRNRKKHVSVPLDDPPDIRTPNASDDPDAELKRLLAPIEDEEALHQIVWALCAGDKGKEVADRFKITEPMVSKERKRGLKKIWLDLPLGNNEPTSEQMERLFEVMCSFASASTCVDKTRLADARKGGGFTQQETEHISTPCKLCIGRLLQMINDAGNRMSQIVHDRMKLDRQTSKDFFELPMEQRKPITAAMRKANEECKALLASSDNTTDRKKSLNSNAHHRCDKDFHLAFAVPSRTGGKVAAEAMTQLCDEFFGSASTDEKKWLQTVNEHDQIIRALENGDRDKAEQAVETHLRNALERAHEHVSRRLAEENRALYAPLGGKGSGLVFVTRNVPPIEWTTHKKTLIPAIAKAMKCGACFFYIFPDSGDSFQQLAEEIRRELETELGEDARSRAANQFFVVFLPEDTALFQTVQNNQTLGLFSYTELPMKLTHRNSLGYGVHESIEASWDPSRIEGVLRSIGVTLDNADGLHGVAAERWAEIKSTILKKVVHVSPEQE